MTTTVDAPPGEISYVQWLQREIADRLNGVWTCCGPWVNDWLTIRDRLGLTARPNASLERQLETQLHKLERQAKPEAELAEAEAEIEM